MPIRLLAAIVLAAAASLLAGRPAEAIPVFAHRYGLTCQACHTTVPHLTELGEAFLAGGYRLPARTPGAAFPLAVKVNLAYGSEAEASLPKAVVDEVELLTGGSIGKRGAYFAEQYVVDGGRPGQARDLWASWRVTPDGARTHALLRGGQFGLELPLDPETFRETTDHYAIWDQTAGENPFRFFTPKIGLSARIGSDGHGVSGTFAALQARDPGSGLAPHGVDRYLMLQQARGNVVLSAYRYDGTRAIAGGDDRFWRQGYGAGFELGRARLDAVYQHGFDTRAGAGAPLRSSGGFVQLRYEVSQRAFAIARYDATQDTAFARALVAGAGFRVARNARLTVFDTMRRAEDRARTYSVSTGLMFAY